MAFKVRGPQCSGVSSERQRSLTSASFAAAPPCSHCRPAHSGLTAGLREACVDLSPRWGRALLDAAARREGRGVLRDSRDVRRSAPRISPYLPASPDISSYLAGRAPLRVPYLPVSPAPRISRYLPVSRATCATPRQRVSSAARRRAALRVGLPLRAGGREDGAARGAIPRHIESYISPHLPVYLLGVARGAVALRRDPLLARVLRSVRRAAVAQMYPRSVVQRGTPTPLCAQPWHICRSRCDRGACLACTEQRRDLP